uniref:Uncharacterized protein n=1 Tax=Brugia malayi TaxID=6279 RepID=A8PL30_BRUMA
MEESFSNLDDIKDCLTQKGECITNTSIIIWNSNDTTNHVCIEKIGRFNATKYNKHFIIEEIQASLIIDENPHILNTKNCRFTSPLLMQGDIIIEVNVEDDSNSTTKFKRRVINKLLMMEKSPDKKFDLENFSIH